MRWSLFPRLSYKSLLTLILPPLFNPTCSNWWSQLPCCKVWRGPYYKELRTALANSQQVTEASNPSAYKELNAANNHQVSVSGSWILLISNIKSILGHINVKYCYDYILDDTLIAGLWEFLSLRTQKTTYRFPPHRYYKIINVLL